MDYHIKIDCEYTNFLNEQYNLTAKEVYQNAYEIVVKRNIRDIIDNDQVELTEDQKMALMLSNNTLDEIYQDWLDNDSENMADIPDTITDTAGRLIAKSKTYNHLIWGSFLAKNELDLNTKTIHFKTNSDFDVFELQEFTNGKSAIYHHSKDNSIDKIDTQHDLLYSYKQALDKYSSALVKSNGNERINVLMSISNLKIPINDIQKNNQVEQEIIWKPVTDCVDENSNVLIFSTNVNGTIFWLEPTETGYAITMEYGDGSIRPISEEYADFDSRGTAEDYFYEDFDTIIEIANSMSNSQNNANNSYTDFKDFCPDWQVRGTTSDITRKIWNGFLEQNNLPLDTKSITFRAEGSEYIGGYDSDGHERKDNYERVSDKDSFYLESFGDSLFIRHTYNSYNFPDMDTELDLSSLNKDYEEALDKYSNYLSNGPYDYVDVKLTNSNENPKLRDTYIDYVAFCPDWDERATSYSTETRR